MAAAAGAAKGGKQHAGVAGGAPSQQTGTGGNVTSNGIGTTGNPSFNVVVLPAQADGGGRVEVSAHVTSMSYADNEEKLDKLTIDVDNFDLTNFDAPVWKAGANVEVSWGYDGNMSPTRSLVIQKVTGGVQLKVECLDKGCLMNRNHVVKTWEKETRSNIATQIAVLNGYTADRQFIDDTTEVLDQVTQARMTDAQLLRDLAKREGFEFYIDFDGFHFHKRKLGQRPLRTFTYYTDPGVGDITSFTIENDLYTRKAGGITAAGIDPKTGKKIEVKADNVATPPTALAPDKIIVTGVSARDGTPTADFLQATGTSAVVRSTEKTAEAAQRHVTGLYEKNQLNAALLNFESRGDPSMIAKIVITINGIGKTLSGNYYVTNVAHKLGSGYTMTVKCRRDGRSAPNNAAAYDEASKAAGVTARGPHSEAPADDKSDPLGLTHKLGGGEDPQKVLTPIANRDGSWSYADTRGRSQQGAPAAPADPLGLGHFNEDTQPNGKR